MKTKHYLLGALAAMMLMTSCQDDTALMGNEGETAMVSFELTTPEITTRADYSDGTTATVLQYAVYDENGEILDDLTVTNGEIKLKTQVNLKLTTGNTYTVIFWAAAPNAPYTVDFDNKLMSVNYDAAVSNDENRDAFYKHHTFTVSGTQSETVELRRPFAQLNIGTNDYEASKSAGYTPTQSSVTVSKIYKSLNLATDEVDSLTTVEYQLANIDRTQKFPVTGYEYIAMNYLLMDKDQELIDVEFTYTDRTDAKTRTVGSVPVRRNYRTNIYGQLLTSNVDINVEIKPEYEGPDYNTLDILKDVLANGGELTLFSDITLDESFTVPAGKNVNIDLNGFTLTVGESNYVDGNLVLSNGNVKTALDINGDLEVAFVARNGSIVEFNNVNAEIADNTAAIYVPNSNVEATINLNNTTMTIGKGGHGVSAIQGAKNLEINLTESTLTGEYAFYLMNTNTLVTLDEKSSVKDFWVMGGNVTVVYEGQKPEIKTDGLAVTITYCTPEVYAIMQVAENGGEVTLTKNIELTEPLNVVAGMVLNLGDYTISNPNGYVIENKADLTITGNEGGLAGLGGIRSKGGKVTISGGTYTGSSDWNKGTYQHILKAENTEVVINGGTFDATIGGITNAMINVSTGSQVTINGGEFKNVNGEIPTFPPYMFTYEDDGKLIINDGQFYGGWRFNGTTATTDIYGGHFTVGYDGQSFHASSTHVLTVYGGTFSMNNGAKLNPTNYVANGYTAYDFGNGIYEVIVAVAGGTIVTPNNISTTVFNENTTYHFIGNFSDKVEIRAAGGKEQVFDGSQATFNSHIKFTANAIAGNALSLTRPRSGKYTFRGFKTPNSIAFGSCEVEALNIVECEAYMMYLNISNSVVTATNNKIVRPANADDAYLRYDGGTQKDIIQVYADNYTLNLYGNTIKDEKGVGNNMEIYGEYGWHNNVSWANLINAEGNTISNANGDMPLVKIYNDVTYAPVAWPTDYEITDAAKKLAKDLKEKNTLEGGSSVVNILCRANGKADANIDLYGNE